MPKRDNGIRLSRDDARLLPRYRDPVLQAAVDERRQKEQLGHSLLDDPDTPLTNLKHKITKPGDLKQLRGIPVLAPGVGSVVANTQPERETVRRLMNQWRLSERIGDAA